MMVQRLSLQQRKQKIILVNPKGDGSKLPSISKKSPPKNKKLVQKSKSLASHSFPAIVSGEKTEQTVVEIATQKLSSVPNLSDNSCGTVIIHYSHYHKHFPIHNGVLKWEDVDKEYCLSFAYPGNFKRTIVHLPHLIEGENLFKRNATLFASDSEIDELKHDEGHLYFIGAINLQEYLLKVEEDPTLITANDTKPIYLDSSTLHEVGSAVKSGNRAVALLTAELKQLSPDSLNSIRAKELIEQRDLEDVLYSSCL